MDTAELLEEFKSSHTAVMERFAKTEKDMQGIGANVADLQQKIARRAAAGGVGGDVPRSWGEQLVESPQFQAFKANPQVSTKIEVKTISTLTMGSSTGGPMIAPMIITDPSVLPRRRMTIRNLIAPGSTTSNSVWFPRQTGRQNMAAMVSEGAAKPQSDITTEQVQSPVRTLATFMNVSRQAMDDAPALMSLVDGELRYNLNFVEEGELLYGDGTGEHLYGLITQSSPYSAPFSVSGETAIDRILLALIQAEQALVPASGIVLNIADWGEMRSLKTTLGNYLLGDPAEQATPQLWSLPIAVTPAITAGTFLVGAFYQAAQIFDRLSAEILMSTEAGNNFTTNLVTVRGEERLTLICKRPSAFVSGSLP
jgi:HK97 family phage major capsid protein